MPSSPFLIDTHCHLHFPPYDHDRDAVLRRARQTSVWMITIGTALGNSEHGIRFAESEPDVWASAGLHPEHATSTFHDPNEGMVEERTLDEERLRRLMRSSAKAVAVGETGLDFFRIDDGLDPAQARADQERLFRQQIEVAAALDRPLVIHCREALGRLADILQGYASAGAKVRGVVHSFTGTWAEAQPLLDLGLFLGINGIATFPLRKTQTADQAIDRTLERMPLDRLLLETDAPYLAPLPYRGERNEPAHVVEVARHAAGVRGQSLENVARQTTENAISLFHLKPV